MRPTKLLFIFLSMLSFNCFSEIVNDSFEEYINKDWKIEISEKLNAPGDQISTQDFVYDKWKTINIPATAFSGLCQNGIYKDAYFSNNLESIPTEQFKKNWWYRKEFKIKDYSKELNYELNFEGINYKANIWLNGHLIASEKEIEGPFRIYNLDITKYAKENNVLAIEVIPPHSTALTIGFVDWNPNAPDNNLGLWRGVKLKKSGKVSVENIAITSSIDLKDYSIADLTVKANLINHSNKKVSGVFKCIIDNNINAELSYTLNPEETKKVVLNKNNNSNLSIKNPRLWWPNNMGKAELYSAQFLVYENNKLSHSKKEGFGVRQISDYTFKIGEKVHRGYVINGKKILLKGAGWVDDMCLSDSDEKVRAQVEYVKLMNLNTIRLEGFWGNSQALYNACDENGILLMIGLSCQWEWKPYCGREESDFTSVESKNDMKMVSQSYQDQVKWGLNHPSIFLWVYGSDKLPKPELEKMLNSYVKELDSDRCTLASCKVQTSEVSGPVGSKMLGPYDYVPPVYWYIDNELGGAYGFNTETGTGAQIPPIESIKKMLKPEDVSKINGKGWQFHCGRNEFQTLNRFLNSYNKRYWKDETIEDFAFNVQLSNYESTRAMFEAFVVNRENKATGIVQWMLNSAWPEMFWQLYDWYLMPNGAFYGTKAACQPLNLIYNYGDKNIYLSNDSDKNTGNLVAKIKVFDINSKLVLDKNININAKPFSVNRLLKIDATENLTDVYFLSLELKDSNKQEVSNNFYWLSKKEDVMDFEKSTWFFTPQAKYADFSTLKSIGKAKIESDCNFEKNGEKTLATVTLKNNSQKIAFFLEMKILNEQTKQSVLPVFWTDNYVSLLPGETKTYKVEFYTKELNNQNPIFSLNGFNLVAGSKLQ